MASEYAKITWEQYGELIETLWQDLKLKLDQHKVHIDAIIPILREGAFTGIPLAYKLNTYKVLPIQYKYLLHDGSNELVKIADLPEVQYEIPSKPVFLLCDTYPCGGKTKELAVADVKCKFKDARFVFASLLQDDTANKIDGVQLAVS